jgi:hypothetical protein
LSREVETIETPDDFLYLAQRNQLPQEWIDANGGDEGVGEIMRGERKVKKPRGSSRRAAAAEEPEEVEEADEEDENGENGENEAEE